MKACALFCAQAFMCEISYRQWIDTPLIKKADFTQYGSGTVYKYHIEFPISLNSVFGISCMNYAYHGNLGGLSAMMDGNGMLSITQAFYDRISSDGITFKLIVTGK